MIRTDRMPHDAAIATAIAAGSICGGVAGWAANLLAARFVPATLRRSSWIAIAGGAVLTPWVLVLSESWLVAAASLFLVAMLLALAIIDAATLRLPDLLTFPMIAVGLIMAPAMGEEVVSRLVGAVLGYVVIAVLAEAFRRTSGREGIGLGDAKLLAGAGAWLGWAALPSVLLIACGAAFAWVAARAVAHGRQGLAAPLPFGPPLALAFLATWTARLAHWI
ncbi:prepilin peptidase [Caulobacter sp.]|uniref:prepilin peptidase n=1 Tax=Caulobacter sp. TaxID=78 RepID=UPI003BAE8668